MGKVGVREDLLVAHPLGPATIQKPVTLTVDTWHALVAPGAALDVAAAFSNPSADACDRIPQVLAAAGGVPFSCTLTGTWNGAAQTDTFACATNATTKATKPFDTITRWQTDVDPQSNVTLQAGDSYSAEGTRWLHVSGAGDINIQLSGETALKVISGVAAGDWRVAMRRISPTSTTATGLVASW